MEENSPTPLEHTADLADAVFDGSLDAEGMQVLESYLLHDPACVQAYVERLSFHGRLLEKTAFRSNEEAAWGLLQDYSQSAARRHQRVVWGGAALFAAACVMVVVFVGRFDFRSQIVKHPIATVAGLSLGSQVSIRKMELGQFLGTGETLTVSKGVVTIQLPNVVTDIVAPATLHLDSEKSLTLSYGTVVTKVSDGGQGFTIRTPDAEIVDLGTEFLVSYKPEEGTLLSVRQGRAQAHLLDQDGNATRVIEITDRRSARIQVTEKMAREVEYQPEIFQPSDRNRGSIQSLGGLLRTLPIPLTVDSGSQISPDHLLIMPEQQAVEIDTPLTLLSLEGPVQLKKGTRVSSYLVHYDPTDVVTIAPRGSVTFNSKVLAVLVHSKSLNDTDVRFGNRETKYEAQGFRALELEEDEVQVSDDRRTVSFYFGVSPPEFLDEVRVLVQADGT